MTNIFAIIFSRGSFEKGY